MKRKRILTPLILAFLCYLSSPNLQAQTYYVASNGNNSKAGTSEGAAWKSIDKVNQQMGNLSGATVLFRRGDVFAGQLNVTAANLTIGAYGSGDLPELSATQAIPQNWTRQSGNIWQVSLNNPPARVASLYEGQESLPLGRTPNLSDPNHQGYYYYENAQKNTTGRPNGFTDNQLSSLSSEDWTGAGVVMRYNRWRLAVSEVIAQNGNTITTGPIERLFNTVNNFGYFFQNDVQTLDQAGEWAFQNGKLYLYSSSDPNQRTLRYSSADYAVRVNNANGVQISQLALSGSNRAALQINNSDNVTADQMQVLNAGLYGVWVRGSAATSLTHVTIRNTNFEGIRTERDAPNARIENCLLENIALTAGRGYDPENPSENGDGYSGMYIIGDKSTVQHNVVRRAGYCGIRADMNSGLIKRNLIEYVCFVKDDGGGIYIQDNTNDDELIVEENILRKITGNGGSVGTNKIGKPEAAEGIYLDTKSDRATVRHNTISGARKGFFMKGTYHSFVNNTVYDSKDFAVLLTESNAVDAVSNVRVEGNVLVGRAGNGLIKVQSTLANASGLNYLNSLGSIVNNYLADPSKGNGKLVKMKVKDQENAYTVTQANNTFSLFSDNQVLDINAPANEPANFELFYDNPSDNTLTQSLPAGQVYTDAQGNTYRGSVSIAPWRSAVLFQTEREAPASQTPFNGPHNLPGRLEAEDFDQGGPGVAYRDEDADNQGNSSYRAGEAVDLAATGGGSIAVGWNNTGEWREYTVNVPNGTYNIIARVASAQSGKEMTLKLGNGPEGTSFATLSSLEIPNKGWSTYSKVVLKDVQISQGGNNKVLRIETTSGAFNIDYVQFTSVAPDDLVLDSEQSSVVLVDGGWGTSTYLPTGQTYQGSNYLVDFQAGQDPKSVRYTPNIPVSDRYNVYGWWVSTGGRASNVPYKIRHSGGTANLKINQRQNGGKWVLLGTYNFTQGRSGYVEISNSGVNGVVIADAVRFEWVGGSTNARQATGVVTATEVVSVTDLQVYPNPVRGELHLRGQGGFSYELYDERGALLRTSSHAAHRFALDVTDLPGGLYLLRTVSPQGIETRKLILD